MGGVTGGGAGGGANSGHHVSGASNVQELPSRTRKESSCAAEVCSTRPAGAPGSGCSVKENPTPSMLTESALTAYESCELAMVVVTTDSTSGQVLPKLT